MARFAPYDEPITEEDMKRYIRNCERIGRKPTFRGWVASETQDMNNNDTNRLHDDAAKLWKEP